MTDRDALLATIVDSPEDDLPRLVFADWLDEHGEPERAEFVRAQVEAASPRHGPGPARPARGAGAGNCTPAYGRAWRVPGLAGVQRFERGFVGLVETAADALLAAGPDVFRGVPVRTVRLVNADRHPDEAARLPVWRTVEALSLNNNSFGAGDRVRRILRGRLVPPPPDPEPQEHSALGGRRPGPSPGWTSPRNWSTST